MKRLACMLAAAAFAAVIPAHSASAAVLVPCDWHGYSLSADTSGQLTAMSQSAYPLECKLYQWRSNGWVYIGSRAASGSPAILNYTVGFNGAYQTQVCTYVNGVLQECRIVW